MHELSYVLKMINLAEESARRENATKVTAITVSIGEMTGVLPRFFEMYYPDAVKGTMLEGSRLTIEEDPVHLRCDACGEEYHPDKSNSYACPMCGSFRGKLLGGRDVKIRTMEIETGHD